MPHCKLFTLHARFTHFVYASSFDQCWIGMVFLLLFFSRVIILFTHVSAFCFLDSVLKHNNTRKYSNPNRSFFSSWCVNRLVFFFRCLTIIQSNKCVSTWSASCWFVNWQNAFSYLRTNIIDTMIRMRKKKYCSNRLSFSFCRSISMASVHCTLLCTIIIIMIGIVFEHTTIKMPITALYAHSSELVVADRFLFHNLFL